MNPDSKEEEENSFQSRVATIWKERSPLVLRLALGFEVLKNKLECEAVKVQLWRTESDHAAFKGRILRKTFSLSEEFGEEEMKALLFAQGKCFSTFWSS